MSRDDHYRSQRRLTNTEWNDLVRDKLSALKDSSPLPEAETDRIIGQVVLAKADLNFDSGKTTKTWQRTRRVSISATDPLTGLPSVRYERQLYSREARIGMVGATIGGMLFKRERRTTSWVLRAIEEVIDSGAIMAALRDG
jgi:hypothetical protein